MAIAVVSWLQNRVGINILGELDETPEEATKASRLKDIQRIAGRISSLKEDLTAFLRESEATLTKGDKKPTPKDIEDMKSLYEQQTDVFTKQLFVLDQITGDDEVREKRKHVVTEIQVALKDIETMQKVVSQCADPATVPEPDVLLHRLSGLSLHDLPTTLPTAARKAGIKVGKKD